MKRKLIGMMVVVAMCVSLVLGYNQFGQVQAAQTLYNNDTGTEDGYNYELWKDNGNTSMTLTGGGTFKCQWSNIGNALFRKGKKFDSTKTYQQIGNISIDYGCDFQPNGNSYLCVYGWTKSPLVEYYIVESWGSWRPPGASSKGTISVDGGTYDVYQTTRVNQPSIEGNTTFQQYWSVRTSKKTSGTISVTDHFKAWESKGMQMGKLYEAALNVEGYQSSGSANVYKNNFNIGGSSNSGNTGNTGESGNTGVPNNGGKIECEDMKLGGDYAGKIDTPFNGVALYGNNDSCTYTQNFKKGTNDFTLRGCSNNSNMARVDLLVGGQNKGTFYFGDENPAEYTIKNVSHGTGNQEVKLVVTADDGQWDGYIDCLQISDENMTSAATQAPAKTQTPATQAPATTSNKIQCEDMTLGGNYAGKIDTPFDGVALYGNNDSCTYTQNFKNSTNDFTLRGCSNNSNMARVDLLVGGQNKGTFYFGDEYPAEYTIKNVSHGTGKQEVKLVVTADDGQWDGYVDYLQISGENENTSTATKAPEATKTPEATKAPEATKTPEATKAPTTASNKIQCEDMTIGGQYTGKISTPFDGVALYANNDSCSYTQNFKNSTDDITLRGCSNNSNMARVDLLIGGQNKGTFYFGDANPAEYTIKNVSHGTGNQKVELVVTADDGQWDAYIDYLQIGGTTSSTGTTGNTGNLNASTKMVAVTFDDGPSSTTSQVLDVLQQNNAVATFFLIGNQVNNNTKSILQRQLSMGCELACHSYTHSDMANMSAYQIKNEISQCSNAIKSMVNYDVKFFRPPYLSVSNTMYQNIDLNFIQGITCNDWEASTSVSQRVNTVLSSVKDGSIILLHDFQGNNNTVQALPQIIQGLKSRGYTLVTVSDLFKYKNVNPNVEYKIWSNVLQ